MWKKLTGHLDVLTQFSTFKCVRLDTNSPKVTGNRL